MVNYQEELNNLLAKLELLMKKQQDFASEIKGLRSEITALQQQMAKDPSVEGETITKPLAEKELVPTDILEVIDNTEIDLSKNSKPTSKRPAKPALSRPRPPKHNVFKQLIPDWKIGEGFEKFIGENLLSKLGIISIIIAVAIGAKYSIDNDLISPLTRIILGYGVGIGLLGFGIKLKAKYETFSAVLVSGAIAIFYFLTYFAYDFYWLIPQLLAFVMMVVFTVFSVVAAINYNKQVIAHIGLVGAYAVPFLLSSGSGQVFVLFSYMAVINIGILVIAFKKYWKALFRSAFILTWLIVASWYAFEYRETLHFTNGLLFLGLFFTIFYVTFIAYKFLQKEQFNKGDVILLLLNAFIFYGIGYLMISNNHKTDHLLGIFTLGNAVIHFIASVLVFKQDMVDRKLFYLLASLVLVFIAIAIPVQLSGSWVTLLWAIQASLLFWLGRTKSVPIFERLSYVLVMLAGALFFQQAMSVSSYYSMLETPKTAVFNVNFLTSLLFSAAFGFMAYINQHKDYRLTQDSKASIGHLFTFIIPVLFLAAVYYTFRVEIETYFNGMYQASKASLLQDGPSYKNTIYDQTIHQIKSVWVINYSLLSVFILCIVNVKFLKNIQFGYVGIGLSVVAILTFLTQGLDLHNSLQYSYLFPKNPEFYPPRKMDLVQRYLSYPFLGLSLLGIYLTVKKFDFKESKIIKIGFDLVLHGSILAVASFELIQWMEFSQSTQSYKLGLSILWGIYALVLIVLGIWKKKKHLRFMAIALFAFTLLKLFFYDISHLNTIAKTIVFLALGILLLIVSFLYTKYKDEIIDDDE